MQGYATEVDISNDCISIFIDQFPGVVYLLNLNNVIPAMSKLPVKIRD